jgi:hypothetical protein
MSIDEVKIWQTSDVPTKCFRYNGSTYDDYSAFLFSATNTTAKELWADSADIIYVGSTSLFYLIGFTVATAPAGYGTFTFEYSKGATVWGTLTVRHNSTSGFSNNGWIAYVVPGDWAVDTVNSVAGYYWIRASQDAASPGTPATAYNLLPNLTLAAPLITDALFPDADVDFSRDSNTGEVKKTDKIYSGPQRLGIDCTNLAVTMADMNLLVHWRHYRRRLYIEDQAFTSPLAFSTDAYFKSFRGYVSALDGKHLSPDKMDAVEMYRLEFKVDTPITLMTLLGAAGP